MSDDIRVYWDEEMEVYSIVINDTVVHAFDDGDDSQYSTGMCEYDLTTEDILVYDSAEDAEHDEWEFSIIDENLVIPNLAELEKLDGRSDSLVRQVFSDYESWCNFWVVADIQKLYHEKRKA